MIQLSETTAHYFKQAGWTPERQTDPSVYIKVLEDEGYTVFEPVKRFIRAFAPLRVFFPHPKDKNLTDDLRLDPIEANDYVTIERVDEDYSPRAGAQLCVVGLWYKDSLVLLMDPGGGMYAAHANLLLQLGSSGVKAIEAIVNGGRFAEVPQIEER